MVINTKNLVSLSEANQNFSQVAKKVEKDGSVVILKNNKPKFVVLNYDEVDTLELSDDEKIDIVAKRVLEKYKKAFKVLAEWLSLKKKKFCFCTNS